MGDEYCEEISGGARGGDMKYPVLGAICGVGERINGELEEGPGESPVCVLIETEATSGCDKNDQVSGRLGKMFV